MKFFLSLILVYLLCLISCNSLSNKSNNFPLKLKVHLLVNDSINKLNSDFSVHVIYGSKVINSKSFEDSIFFELPKEIETEKIQIDFIKGIIKIKIDNVPAFLLTDKRPKDLVFGLASKPYFDSLGLILKKDSLVYKSVKTISYLRVEPLDNGIGRIYKNYKRE